MKRAIRPEQVDGTAVGREVLQDAIERALPRAIAHERLHLMGQRVGHHSFPPLDLESRPTASPPKTDNLNPIAMRHHTLHGPFPARGVTQAA